jgi:predicted aminopeptidase
MKDYSAYQLADLIIHELLHATVFIKGQVQFNEQLAEFVGTRGARLYTADRFGVDSQEYKAIDENAADADAFRGFLQGLIAGLEGVYDDPALDREAKLAEKERIIRAAQERFDAEYGDLFKGENYRGFSKLPVNNAYLDLYRLYHEEDGFLADLYQRNCENSTAGLRRFIEAAKTLKPGKGDPREQLERALVKPGR